MPDGIPGAEASSGATTVMGDATANANLPASGEGTGARPDEVLIERFLRGEEAAFHQLVGRYKRDMVNYLYRMVGDVGWAEDLAQDVFLKVFLKARNFRARSKFSTWLYRIAHNRAIDFLKRRKHEPKLVLHRPSEGDREERDFEIPSRGMSPDDETVRNELEARVMSVIDAMDEKYRTIFVLCAMKRLSYEEAAAVTGLSVKTVSSRLCRARKFFRAKARPFLDHAI